jgi:hypothetical protein
LLESQLQAELDVAGTARTKNRVEVSVTSVRRSAGTAELAAKSAARAHTGWGWSQVNSVEEIEELHSELRAVPFLYPPELSHRKVDVVIHRANEGALGRVAERPVSGRSQDSIALREATEIGQRSKRELA